MPALSDKNSRINFFSRIETADVFIMASAGNFSFIFIELNWSYKIKAT